MRTRAVVALATLTLTTAVACGRGETAVADGGSGESRITACRRVDPDAAPSTSPPAPDDRARVACTDRSGTIPVREARPEVHEPGPPVSPPRAAPVPPSTTPYLYRQGPGYFEGTVTAVRDLSPAAALGRLVDRPEVGPTDLATAEAWLHRQRGPRYGALVIAVRRGEWTFILEANGFLGVTDERILALSAGSRAVAIHHLTDGAWCHFSMADNGQMVRDFGQEHYDGPHTIGARLPEEDGLALGEVSHSWDSVQVLFRRIVGRDAFGEIAAARPEDAVAVGHLPY